jgi:putative phosphoribosyl transferase
MFDGFADRREAGRALAAKLAGLKNRENVMVPALPRGGVPVAFEVAVKLNQPLDVFLVRKLGIPGQEELAFGAIAAGGITVFNESLVKALKMPDSMIQRVIESEERELERREKMYRRKRPPLDLKDKTVIIVDDGLATGATMRAAIAAVKTRKPKQIIVAAPVASRETCAEIVRNTDDLCVCATTPEPFYGVGMWYQNFDQTSDAEVVELLDKARNLKAETAAGR